MADADHFSSHLPTLAATAAGTVLAAVAGGYLGVAGTMAGLIGGSLVTGVTAWWIDRGLRRSAALAKAKATAVRRRGRPLTDAETVQLSAIVEASERRKRVIPWRLISVSSAAAVLAGAGAVTGLEYAYGNPVSAVVQQPPTLTGPQPAPAASTVAPSPTLARAASPSVTASASASPSPSASPSTTRSATASPVPSGTAPTATGASTAGSPVPSLPVSAH
jgi:serine/threonine-protein kinase